MVCNPYAFGGGPADADFANVSLFIPYEGANDATGFIDRGPANRTITNNNTVKIKTAVTKFGNPTGLFESSGGRYLTVADDAAFQFGSGDFTIELFFRFESFGSSFRALCSKWKTSGGTDRAWWIGTNETTGTKRLEFDCGDGASGSTSLVGTTGLTTGVFYFIQVRRSGTTLQLLLDGSVEAQNTSFSKTLNASSLEVKVGASQGGSADSFADGYMSNIRITKGVARPTTVPTAEFPRH